MNCNWREFYRPTGWRMALTLFFVLPFGLIMGLFFSPISCKTGISCVSPIFSPPDTVLGFLVAPLALLRSGFSAEVVFLTIINLAFWYTVSCSLAYLSNKYILKKGSSK
jgi:hypothetical protein